MAEALVVVFIVGQAAEDELLDVLGGGEAEGVGLCGELGFDFGLEFEGHHGV